MARFDVDGSPPTYQPSTIEWQQPERVRRNDGSSTRSSYWFARLRFESDGGQYLPAALEAWEAYDDGAEHTIVLPPPNNVAGSDATYSNIVIEIEDWPAFVSVNTAEFSVLVGPATFTS